MKAATRAMILGLGTEAVAACVVIADSYFGVVAAGQKAVDQETYNQAMNSAPHGFYLFGHWLHQPAVSVLTNLDWLVASVLGLGHGKTLFFSGFDAPHPAWGLICLTQALLWIVAWASLLFLMRVLRGTTSWREAAYMKHGNKSPR